MPIATLKPYWQATDGSLRLYHGDVRQTLKRLPAGIYQTVVTSPPYWRLRDYGVDGQLGSEKTPEEFVANLVNVFRDVRRVLRDDGTVWLNLGDSYLANGNLVGIPWRVALSLQEDGWVLRQDIVWHKPSTMPESVTNRCTKAHEYIFLLGKARDYYYDAEPIREPLKMSDEAYRKMLESKTRQKSAQLGSATEAGAGRKTDGFNSFISDGKTDVYVPNGANKRTVWTVPSESYAGAHFATFPRKLIEPCILAGTSEYGACAECGAPYKRVIEKEALKRDRPNDYVKRKGEAGTGNSCANSVAGVSVKTLGWEATCACESEEVVPCRVLDPFAGSATTLDVALAHGRHADGIELSKAYLDNNAIPRCTGALLSIPEKAHLAGKRAERFELGEGA